MSEPETGQHIVYGVLEPPGTYTPRVRLNVRDNASTRRGSRVIRQVKPNQPVYVFGYWINYTLDEYWLAIDGLLSEWVAHRYEHEWMGALVFDDMAQRQKEVQNG